jgi:DNA-binding CsgD family transcriptional regulator
VRIVKIKGYLVREDGVVFGRRGKELRWYNNGRGYLITRLRWDDDRWMTKALHTVVCEAFHGERPEGYEAAHINGDSSNNHKNNLKWMTKTENRKQMYQDGRDVSGTKNANSKYSVEQIKNVCGYLSQGDHTQKTISAKTGVSIWTVWAIKRRKQWLGISKNYSF